MRPIKRNTTSHITNYLYGRAREVNEIMKEGMFSIIVNSTYFILSYKGNVGDNSIKIKIPNNTEDYEEMIEKSNEFIISHYELYEYSVHKKPMTVRDLGIVFGLKKSSMQDKLNVIEETIRKLNNLKEQGLLV